MGYQGLPNLLTSIYIEREKEKESENFLLGNEQQKQKQKQDSVVGSMRKKNGKISKIYILYS